MHMQIGDSIAPGDMCCEVETDKATISSHTHTRTHAD